MATSTNKSTSYTRTAHGRPVTRTVSILSKRKSLWKMVRSVLLPTRVVKVFAACGGSGVAARRRRHLERARDKGKAPFERRTVNPASVTQALREMSLAEGVEVETVESYQATRNINTTEGQSPSDEPQIQSIQVEVQVEVTTNIEHNDTDSIRGPDSDPPPEGGGEIRETETNLTTTTNEEIIVRYRDKKQEERASVDGEAFHGWRKSSIDVNTEPPLTLKWIPSGLQVGDQVIWMFEEQPERGVVRWIGKIRQQFYAGVEFDRSIGNSSGLYGYGGGLVARLFTCDLGRGRFIPIDELVLHSDFHDKGIKAGFICIICRDDFLELPDAAGDDGQMVATKCGHLYHGTCLHSWFAAKTKGKCDGSQKSHPCPHCQSPIHLLDIIRLFPAQV